ncbi:hypothetical protein TanjilG_21860 [Lupinus angustifolius]|uniref:Uncharacterized protein n=1 Tax=Lupinus angustifolius TaxID=3871 RepID=A0A1J7GNW0_LUPAN|nr:PREDICTED: uncharacterized protein LOC109360211 [Lupinus angustifolius]OIW02207.1 hypothetical protein TanjilG_21860 [Lupinus angustifolius]
MDVYMGETNRECEPEMLNHYEESSQRAVMEICIEEGASTESNKEKKGQNSFPCKSNKDEEMKNDNSVLNLPTTNEPDQVSADDCPRPISLFEIISLETDSSASSTRSFTFPKLELVEGNETPEMMVKADNNRDYNRKGWKRMLCCKF